MLFRSKMSEIHGMSQRGGNVSTQIRYGEKVYSPIIGKGEADVIVAFEKMEALRWIEYLNPKGSMVINDFEIPSVPILMGKKEYPPGILDELYSKVNIKVFKAGEIANQLGNPKTMNIVLLGSIIKAMNLTHINWENIIKSSVKKGFEEVNIKALNAGMAQV